MILGKKRIAVFDANQKDCDAAAEAILVYYKEAGMEAPEIAVWTEDLPFRLHLKSMADRNEHYDMAFIGADTMKGTDLARTVRDYDKDRPLFLVSGSVEFAVEGFRMRALDYLTKPVSPKRIGEAIARIQPAHGKGGDEA